MSIDLKVEPPKRLEIGAWHGHLIFGQWIVSILKPKLLVELGTYKGDSYFSFCQAVKKNGLDTLCHAVDSWEGEPHAGFYGEDVYESVSRYNERYYSSFSTLHRCMFDDAVSLFADESIDFMHIDGFHTYDAVKHDFEAWRPKLAKNAVVLFHDTAEVQRNFGVWKFWEELEEEYQNHHFLFLHSHGLGVLGVGDVYPKQLEALFQADGNQVAMIRDTFSRLNEILIAPVEKRRLATENDQFQVYIDTGSGLSEKEKESTNLEAVEGRMKFFLNRYKNVKFIRVDFGRSPKILVLSDLVLTCKNGDTLVPTIKGGTFHERLLIPELKDEQGLSSVFIFTNKNPRLFIDTEPGEYVSLAYRYRILGFEEITSFERNNELTLNVDDLNKQKKLLEETGWAKDEELRTMKGIKTQLEGELEKKLSQISDLEETGRAKDKEILTLKETQTRQEVELEEKLSQLNTLGESSRAKDEELRTMKGIKTQLEVELEEKLSQLNALGESSRAKDEEIRTIKESRALLKENLEEKISQISDIEDKILKKEALIRELKDLQSGLKKSIDDKSQEINGLKESIREKDAILTSKDEEIKKRTDELDTVTQQVKRELSETKNMAGRLAQEMRNELVKKYRQRHMLRIVKRMCGFFIHPKATLRYRRDKKDLLASGLFDENYYIEDNKDLYFTVANPIRHFLMTGFKKGRNPHPLFDTKYYYETYPDIKRAGLNPVLHYIRYGAKEGRNPHPLFDTKFYIGNYPDVKSNGVNPLMHYLNLGWKERRNPNPNFDTDYYLTTYSDIRIKNVNPLSHYILYGIKENRNTHLIGSKDSITSNKVISRNKDKELLNKNDFLYGDGLKQIYLKIENYKKENMSIEKIAIQTGLFNEKYYINNAKGINIKEPFKHYLERGYLLGLNPSSIFNTSQYLDANRDVYWANMNPLFHFIKYGYSENRKMVHPGDINSEFHRSFGKSEYGVTGPVLYYDREIQLNPRFNLSIGVHLHLFYIDLAEELLSSLINIPVCFSLFISTSAGVKDQEYIKKIVNKKLPLCNECTVIQTENRGRDIAPFIVEFGNSLSQFDLILHFHSKKSLHSDSLSDARRFLLHYILGNKAITIQNLNMFFENGSIGMVAPPYHPSLRNMPNFGLQEYETKQFLKKMGINYSGKCTDFPAGSFFWCRKDAIRQLLTSNIRWNSFPEEKGQIDGTLAHVIERSLGIICKQNNFKIIMPYIDVSYNLVNYYSNGRNINIKKKNFHLQKSKRKNQIAYVTAILGNLDNLLWPEHIEKDVDYYCFTDNKMEDELFKISMIDYQNEDKRMMARYVKTHLIELLPEYKYIIWIDANIYFRGYIKKFINELNEKKMFIGTIAHNQRKDCFSEALECIKNKLDDAERIKEQMKKYINLPDELFEYIKRTRLAETNFIIYNCTDPRIKGIQNIWWQEIENYSKRDQLSFNYSLAKENISYYSFLNEKKSVRDDPRFAMLSHKKRYSGLQKRNANLAIKEDKINYRTYDDMYKLLIKMIKERKIDSYDMIVGIPRSGMVPAYFLGLILNLPVISYDEFINETIILKGDRKLDDSLKKNNESQRILFIDDSINMGNAYKRFKENLPETYKNKDFIWDYYAVFGSENAIHAKYFELCKMPRIFQWNYKNHPLSRYFCYDLDGVLCIDPTEEENDDGKNYIDFIKNTKPLYIPKYQIKAIVTSRLEKYRELTEKWLNDNDVRYEKLYMLDLPSKEERIRLNAHASFKAKVYSEIKEAILFVESNSAQAKEIAVKVGKPVICTDNDNLY